MTTDAHPGLLIVADETASPDGVAQSFLEQLAGGANRTAMLVSTSAALVLAVRDAFERARRAEPAVRASWHDATCTAIAPDLVAAAELVARRRPVLLALRLSQPQLFVKSLAASSAAGERRAA